MSGHDERVSGEDEQLSAWTDTAQDYYDESGSDIEDNLLEIEFEGDINYEFDHEEFGVDVDELSDDDENWSTSEDSSSDTKDYYAQHLDQIEHASTVLGITDLKISIHSMANQSPATDCPVTRSLIGPPALLKSEALMCRLNTHIEALHKTLLLRLPPEQVVHASSLPDLTREVLQDRSIEASSTMTTVQTHSSGDIWPIIGMTVADTQLDTVKKLLASSSTNDFVSLSPLQFLNSPSAPNHFQSANALALGPEDLLFYYDSKRSNGRDGELRMMRMQRPLTIMGDHLLRCGSIGSSNLLFKDGWIAKYPTQVPCYRHLADVVNYTNVEYKRPRLPVVVAHRFDEDDILCIDVNYGMMAVGAATGRVQLFDITHDIPECLFAHHSPSDMVNSVQITRRWLHPGSDDQAKSDFQASSLFQEGEFDKVEYSLLVVRNSGRIEINTVITPSSDNHRQFDGPCLAKTLHCQGEAFNDAKLSPCGRWIAVVGDRLCIWLSPVDTKRGKRTFGPLEKIAIDPLLLPKTTNSANRDFTSQYLAFSPTGEYLAFSSDSHPVVVVMHLATRKMFSIPMALPTFAISFCPNSNQNLLAVSNRADFVHMIDIDTLQRQVLYLRTAVTSVSTNGTPKAFEPGRTAISGLRWSTDGGHLYIATSRRVLVFRRIGFVPSLKKLCSDTILNLGDLVRDISRVKGSESRLREKRMKRQVQEGKQVSEHVFDNSTARKRQRSVEDGEDEFKREKSLKIDDPDATIQVSEDELVESGHDHETSLALGQTANDDGTDRSRGALQQRLFSLLTLMELQQMVNQVNEDDELGEEQEDDAEYAMVDSFTRLVPSSMDIAVPHGHVDTLHYLYQIPEASLGAELKSLGDDWVRHMLKPRQAYNSSPDDDAG